MCQSVFQVDSARIPLLELYQVSILPKPAIAFFVRGELGSFLTLRLAHVRVFMLEALDHPAEGLVEELEAAWIWRVSL